MDSDGNTQEVPVNIAQDYDEGDEPRVASQANGQDGNEEMVDETEQDEFLAP